jgi:hypothetical protein
MIDEIKAILAKAAEILAGQGHQTTGPAAFLQGGGKGYAVTRETYTHPDTAARAYVKSAFEAWVDKMPIPRDWDMIDAQQALLIEAAAAIGIKNIGI